MKVAFRRLLSDLLRRVPPRSQVHVPGTRIALLVLALLAPVIVLIGTRLMGITLGYGAMAETMLFPILVGAAWGGGVGALAAGVIATAIMSPLALHQLLSVHESVLTPGLWVFQGAVFATFAGTSAAVMARPSQIQDHNGVANGQETAFEGYQRVLASLANTVEVRDHHTQGHCERVARNALVMGRALGITAREMSVLYWAARLHDLGKIAVPEYILLKSGRLTEDEFSEIRRHPAYGADLLASVSVAFRPIADVVRAHHERWDGLGYPLGLKGEEIPRLARVIAVVDVFEALTSERPYRSPMPATQAMQYIRNGSRTQFDPELVTAFERLYERGEIERAGAPSFQTSYEVNAVERIALHQA